MPPKLILHAGTHKTGTTAIQAFAAMHAEALAGRGVIYPDLAGLGRQFERSRYLLYPHHIFAHALADDDEVLTAADAARLAGLWAEDATAQNASVFVSSEPLYRHALAGDAADNSRRGGRARYLDRVAAALAPFDVEVVLVFRRPEDFVRSMFQENVKQTARLRWASFAAFRAQALGGALRYAENAALFAERFGRVRCLVYEDLPSGAPFCQRFFEAIGVNAAGLEPVGTVRASLDAVGTAVKHFLGRAGEPDQHNKPLLRWATSPDAAALTAERLGPGPFGLWESAAARTAFVAATAPEVERLRAEFFPDRAVLFPPSSEKVLPPVPVFDAELRAALIAGYRAAVGAPEGDAAHPRPHAARLPGAKRRKQRSPGAGAPTAGPPTAPARTPTPIETFVLIIGAARSGTTSLFHCLAAHPQIAACSKEEPNFFSDDAKWRQGPTNYYALWPTFDPAIHRCALEASTNYARFPHHPGVAHRIRMLSRRDGVRFKLIYIMRNPLDRIEAHLAHAIARGRRKPDPDHGLRGALAVSSYARQLDRYAPHFPAEDLLLLDFDDLRADRVAVVARCLAFLGLDAPAGFEHDVARVARFDADVDAAPHLDADRRAALRAALREDTAALRDRYGVDVRDWDIV